MWPSQLSSLCAWPFLVLNSTKWRQFLSHWPSTPSCQNGIMVHATCTSTGNFLKRWYEEMGVAYLSPIAVCLSKVVMLIMDYSHHLKPWLVLCPMLRCIYRRNLATFWASMFQLKTAAQSGPKCHPGSLGDANSGWLTYWLFLLSW